MRTPILNPEDLVKYVETRIFGDNVDKDRISEISQYNGCLNSALEYDLNTRYGDKVSRVKQKNEREPLYSIDDKLFFAQWSGFGRGRRYESNINAYRDITGKDIDFKIIEKDGLARKTNIAYDDFCYDFVMGLFVPEEKYEPKRVFSDFDIADLAGIDTIIFGPLNAVAKQGNVLQRGTSEYLDSQIVSFSNKLALNLGYVYSDQAGRIIDKILREYEGISRDEGKLRTIDIYMFGRVGGLMSNHLVNDLVLPNGVIDQTELSNGAHITRFNNTLGGRKNSQQFVLNVPTVIDETVEDLKLARSLGAVCAEMETRETMIAIDLARSRYHNLKVNFGFVGYVSDVPLNGITLANEMDCSKGEIRAAELIAEMINER